MARAKFVPHPGKQTEFLASTVDRIFYGGARGGSKSFSLSWKVAFQPTVYYYVFENRRITRAEFFVLRAAGKDPKFIVEKMNFHHPDFIGILIRRTHPQLQRNLKPETDKLYRQYGAVWKERHNCYVFPSGAKIYLVHCIDRKALDDYIGGNYNFIGIDEANMFPEEWVDMLETSLRTDNPEIVPQLCLTSNPGNLGHTWLKKNYVDKCTPIPDGPKVYNKEFDVWHQPYITAPPYVDSEGILRQFIPATVFDNPSLINNDKNYVRKLKQLNPTMRAMWLEGRWDVFAGMFFDMWDPAKHIISGKAAEKFEKFGTKDFNKNTHTLFRFYDYGTKAPFVCLFAAIDQDNRLIIFDEIVEKGLSATAQAKEVNEYTESAWNLGSNDFADDICDPSYDFLTSEKNSERYSPLMHYEDEGIILTTAARDRKIAAKVVYNGLSGKNPNIRFTENCDYMIETIPNLPQKENFIEDVEDKGTDDHGYDALKYGSTEVLEGGGYAPEPKKKGWRDELEEYQSEMANSSDGSFMGI